MSENTEEKFGKILYNGRLVDLDQMSIEEREEVINNLEKQVEQIENQVDKILEVEN